MNNTPVQLLIPEHTIMIRDLIFIEKQCCAIEIGDCILFGKHKYRIKGMRPLFKEIIILKVKRLKR